MVEVAQIVNGVYHNIVLINIEIEIEIQLNLHIYHAEKGVIYHAKKTSLVKKIASANLYFMLKIEKKINFKT